MATCLASNPLTNISKDVDMAKFCGTVHLDSHVQLKRRALTLHMNIQTIHEVFSLKVF